MTASRDTSTAGAEPVFDPTVVQLAALNVALPPAGTRQTVAAPTGDAALVQLSPGTDFGQVCVFRQGTSLFVTARGFGQLVIANTPPDNPMPPQVANAQGQVAQAEALGAGCGTGGAAAGLAGIAPAAGGAAALAQIAPAAGPAGAPGGPGGEVSGGHFNSIFAPSVFDGLNYGPVDPLAFNRTPPELTPGTGITTEEGPAPGFDSLDFRSNSAVAGIPTAETPTWESFGPPLDPADLNNGNEGVSVYSSLVATPDTASVPLLTSANVTITLLNENAGFQNITGYYTYDDGGNITGVKILWLNSAPDGATTEADLYGKTGDLTESFSVAGNTNLGFFLIADGGGDGSYTQFGVENKALFDQLFAALGVDPTALGSSDEIVGYLNDHLRYDSATKSIQIDVDGDASNGETGWTSLSGFDYYSHDTSLNADAGQSNLVGDAEAHTVSGQNAGSVIVGFEDLPFIGTADSPTAPTSFVPGAGYPDGVIPPDFDYNDAILGVSVRYLPVEIEPGVWSPLTAIDNSLNGGLGDIAQVAFVAAGLGDGVSLSLSSPLTAGWTLDQVVDGNGNGSYTLLPPGGSASSAAFVSELAKLQIDVSASTPIDHVDVTLNFTATDTNGTTDSSTSVLDFTDAGVSPPAPAEVVIDAGSLPLPSPTVEQLITT